MGDALALAAWAQLFDDGLILDPRPILALCAQSTIDEMLRLYPADSGASRLATAEAMDRGGSLGRPWDWSVVGIGVGQIVVELGTRGRLRRAMHVYSRREALLHLVEAGLR